MSPERIGPYKIDRKIGAGGMGTVYLGVHDDTGQQVAVKVLPPMLAREPGFLARFHREIAALKKLHHPHVVELYDSGVDGDISYYSMEYVAGSTVMTLLKEKKRIPWEQVIEMGIQICGALKAAHNAGIIHRDLKPSNLLLTEDGDIRLTDFGVAQVFAAGKLTVTGGVIGTAEYMSPEQAAGRRAEKRSDIYSLGAVMYVMLTGRPPFTGKTAFDIAQKHIKSRFDSPRMIVPEIPYWLDEVICQCLEKQPEDRYPDAYVLAKRLEEIPRKLALSASDQTMDFDSASPTDETMASNADPGEPTPGDEALIGATFVRDLVKAQLEEQTQPTTTVSRALDNVWILAGLLGLLIVGGFAWFKYVDVDTASDLDRPLTLTKAAEINDFMSRAKQARDQHRRSDAVRIYQSLINLLPDDASYDAERLKIRKQIDRLNDAQPAGLYPLLNNALERANALQEEGDIDMARTVWQSILDLYDVDDPAAKGGCEQAQSRLNETAPTTDN